MVAGCVSVWPGMFGSVKEIILQVCFLQRAGTAGCCSSAYQGEKEGKYKARNKVLCSLGLAQGALRKP